jgi:hypothetical protein
MPIARRARHAGPACRPEAARIQKECHEFLCLTLLKAKLSSRMSDDLFPGDGCVSEQAEKLKFHADQNSWETSFTEIKVAKKMFAHGQIYGCIRFLDLSEKAVKVLKKSIKSVEALDDIHAGVKMQCLGELCASLFSSIAPPSCRTSFISCCVYVLKQRPNQPSVRVEEFIGEKYEKRVLGVNPPSSATPQDILDHNKFAAFQFFTFMQSDRNMVFISATKVTDRMLTRPVVASLDQNLGGKDDLGSDGIGQWVAEFSFRFSPLLGLTKDQIFATDPVQLFALMDDMGLFTGRAKQDPLPASVDIAAYRQQDALVPLAAKPLTPPDAAQHHPDALASAPRAPALAGGNGQSSAPSKPFASTDPRSPAAAAGGPARAVEQVAAEPQRERAMRAADSPVAAGPAVQGYVDSGPVGLGGRGGGGAMVVMMGWWS